MPLEKELSLELIADKYLEYAGFTKLLIRQFEKYGLHIRYTGTWRLTHIGITEGRVGESLGSYEGTAQEILAIAIDLYVKTANLSK